MNRVLCSVGFSLLLCIYRTKGNTHDNHVHFTAAYVQRELVSINDDIEQIHLGIDNLPQLHQRILELALEFRGSGQLRGLESNMDSGFNECAFDMDALFAPVTNPLVNLLLEECDDGQPKGNICRNGTLPNLPLQPWAHQYADAMGKIPAAISEGGLHWIGAFDSYNLLTSYLLQDVLPLQLLEIYTTGDHVQRSTSLLIVTICVLAVLVLLVLWATLYTQCYLRKPLFIEIRMKKLIAIEDEKPDNGISKQSSEGQNALVQWVHQQFCLRENLTHIFLPEEPDDIPVLNGILVLTLGFLVLGMTFFQPMVNDVWMSSNFLRVLRRWFKMWRFQIYLHSYLASDSLMFISACLTSYAWLQKTKRDNEGKVSARFTLSFLLHKIWKKPFLAYLMIALAFIAHLVTVCILMTPSTGQGWYSAFMITPWCRAGSYLIGMVAGISVDKFQHEKLRFHPALAVMCWFVALCFPSLMFTTLDMFINEYIWPQAALTSIHAFAHNGILKVFLGHPAWQPLSRLSKQAILIHSFVISISIYKARSLVYFDYAQLLMNAVANIWVSLCLALIGCLMWLLPLTKRRSTKINEDQRRSTKINEDQRRSTKIKIKGEEGTQKTELASRL
ncbi:hypothetical protein CAPTEDRAFT_202431 [Capitella teleta]|uniref:Nose resistant-to-fluoxetine protein N-terminal domain-containing protein n=1 Tax=Capitella teleta TaxID=283909 RepID=R7TZ70_CAPTE|nr:hypothetical protein CAPTEDRAFT_202431 [Capitella teleta]|eukprot:ELT99228.1 hypothetical protein CAPTEDRAFT_202431 [Capitella teleta]